MNSIDIFPWNEHFNTGVPKIDEQHKRLVQFINLLAGQIAFQSDIPALNVIFDQLTDYAAYHFQTEESIWHEYFPEDNLESEHKQTHADFIKTVLQLRNQANSKPKVDIIASVLTFLTRWLAGHILEEDRHLAMVVLAMQTGMPLEAAKQHASQQLNGSTKVLLEIILTIYESLSANAFQRVFAQAVIDAETNGIAVCHSIDEAPYVRFTVWNRSMETLTGFSLEEINRHGWYQTVYRDPEAQQRSKQHLERTRHGEHLLGGEWVITRKDGEQRIVQIHTAICAYDADGIHVLGVMHDATESKQLEIALHDSNQELQSLLNSMAEGAYGVDTNGYCKFVNRSFLRILGYDHEDEIIGKHIHELIHHSHDDGSPYSAEECLMYTAYRRNEEIHASDEVLWRKDGTPVPVELWSQPIITHGVVTGAIATFIDITDRKKAEEVRHSAAQYARSLIEASLDPLVTISAEGKITDVNTSTEAVTGVGREGLIGSDFADYFTDPDQAQAGYQLVFSEGFVTDYPLAIRHKSGKITDVLYNASVYRDANGKVLGAFAAARDITESKKAEEIRQSAAQYARSLIEASLDPLVSISAEGKITDVNTATEAVTGIGREGLIGSDFADYFTDPQQARAGYQLVFSQGFVTDYPLAIRHRSGKITEVLYNASLYRDVDGKVLGVFAAARDITEFKQIEAQLMASESRLRCIIDSEPECIKIVDANGQLLQMNAAGLAMIEADSLEQVAGQRVINLIAPEYRDAYIDLHRRVLAGEAMQLEYEVIGLKGGRRWLETHAVPMTDANGSIVHLAVTRDISARKQAEQDMHIAAIVFESQEGMMVTDIHNNILRVNQAFTEITGYTADEVIGQNPNILSSDRHDPNFYAAMWDSVNANARWEGEIWNQRKNGEIYPQYLTITAVKGQTGKVTNYVGTLTDITHRKAAAEEIEHLAFFDPLTNLPNRRLLQDRLKPALAASQRSGRKGALLFIDLDNFKALNDTLGHDMGDLLLQQVAERLVGCVREEDTVARLGGDEFVIMLEYLSERSAEAATQTKTVGNKILAVINQPFQLKNHEYSCTPSIGATLFNGHEKTVEELLKHADIAMYEAKTSGRNALRFFDPKMQEIVAARVALEEELRLALRDRQFVLYYQVQVKSSGFPFGAEALIRWSHPELGPIPPSDFIPVAEETGLILIIGHWVLETACRQLKAWQQTPSTRNLVLSVNVSGKQFFQPDFVDQVVACIQRYGVDPTLLKLELTESILLEDIEETIAIMEALVKFGVQFSLDDFGTGYSSLQYLKKLPLSQLKIDQSFVRDIANDNSDRTIVRTIIAMANTLNLSVIAEGVETEEQQQILQANGCETCQGYLFSKPLPIEQFDHYLKQTEL